MSETDATGALYFTNLLKFATEAFEEFLAGHDFKEYLFPIVSAKSSYKAPLFRNDEINLKLSIAKIGNSSIEVHTHIEKNAEEVGFVEIVHVVTSLETKQKLTIPDEVRKLLSPIIVFGV